MRSRARRRRGGCGGGRRGCSLGRGSRRVGAAPADWIVLNVGLKAATTPAPTKRLDPLCNALGEVTISVPAVTAVPPLNVFVPDSVTVLSPASTLSPPLPLTLDVKFVCPALPPMESVKPLVLIVWPNVISEPMLPVTTLLLPSSVTGMLKVVLPAEALPSIAPLSSMALPLKE